MQTGGIGDCFGSCPLGWVIGLGCSAGSELGEGGKRMQRLFPGLVWFIDEVIE